MLGVSLLRDTVVLMKRVVKDVFVLPESLCPTSGHQQKGLIESPQNEDPASNPSWKPEENSKALLDMPQLFNLVKPCNDTATVKPYNTSAEYSTWQNMCALHRFHITESPSLI